MGEGYQMLDSIKRVSECPECNPHKSTRRYIKTKHFITFKLLYKYNRQNKAIAVKEDPEIRTTEKHPATHLSRGILNPFEHFAKR